MKKRLNDIFAVVMSGKTRTKAEVKRIVEELELRQKRQEIRKKTKKRKSFWEQFSSTATFCAGSAYPSDVCGRERTRAVPES